MSTRDRRQFSGPYGFMLAGFAIAAFSGCASPRVKPTELVNARAELDQTSANAEVARRAPVALLQARKLVDQAETAFTQSDDHQAIHLAKLGSQRVVIAEQLAQALEAKSLSETTLRNLEVARALAREAKANKDLLEARGQVESARRAADDLNQQLAAARSQAYERERESATEQAQRSQGQMEYWIRQQQGSLPAVSAPAPQFRDQAAVRYAEQVALQEREATRALSERMAELDRSRAEATRRALGLQDSSAASLARSRQLQDALDRAEQDVRKLQGETDQSADRLRELRQKSASWRERVAQLELENAAEQARVDALSLPSLTGETTRR